MRCDARVAEALRAMSGVEAADVDWGSGTALVTHAADIDEDSLKRAVESAAHGTHHNYKVQRIQPRDEPGGKEAHA